MEYSEGTLFFQRLYGRPSEPSWCPSLDRCRRTAGRGPAFIRPNLSLHLHRADRTIAQTGPRAIGLKECSLFLIFKVVMGSRSIKSRSMKEPMVLSRPIIKDSIADLT